MRLMREIRCFLTASDDGGRPVNTWSGTPGEGGLAPFLRLGAVVDGPIDEYTGYVCNIKRIDEALRERTVPLLRRRFSGEQAGPVAVMPDAWSGLADAMAPLHVDELKLWVSPMLCYAVSRKEPAVVQLTQSYEFSASHRLFRRELTDDENLALFGKCAHPGGHGHNYIVQITVAAQPDRNSGLVTDVASLDRNVRDRVIERFDHKHLNVDCAEFADRNPTVENIAVVIWELLLPAITDCTLDSVRVWETAKTYAEFRGA